MIKAQCTCHSAHNGVQYPAHSHAHWTVQQLASTCSRRQRALTGYCMAYETKQKTRQTYTADFAPGAQPTMCTCRSVSLSKIWLDLMQYSLGCYRSRRRIHAKHHGAHCVKLWRHPLKWKYTTYRNTARQSETELRPRTTRPQNLVVWSCSFRDMRADRVTNRYSHFYIFCTTPEGEVIKREYCNRPIRSFTLHCKNTRISTVILWRVFRI